MTQTTGSKPELEAIDRVRESHVSALNAGDAKGWADQFTDDAVQMPPHFPTNAGIQAIRGWSGGFLSLFNCKFGLAVDEVRVAGDWAFERGSYNITLSPKTGGPAMNDAGKYLTIYQRQSDGTWKMARDIWNSDVPMPGGA